jgi:arylsulfatase A-like enzyme
MNRPDLVLIITDQERYPQHWPVGLRDQLMPTWARLERHGLTFNNAYCAATQCSPSRAVMFTGHYAPANGVPTLQAPTATDKGAVLTPCGDLPNLASWLRQNGYDVALKGKWHLSFPVGFKGGSPATEVWTGVDIANLQKVYGIPGWNPPDAGNNAFDTPPAALTTLGGGTADNDGRFVSGPQPDTIPAESAIDYLRRMAGTPRALRPPFCLFVSLVNPHDIAYFPNGWDKAGYAAPEFSSQPVAVAPNASDPLVTKPRVQSLYKQALETEGPLDAALMTQYSQFYAYLHQVVDAQIGKVLDVLDETGLTNETVILRTADHGELGLSHGLREKAYSAYEEMIHVPLCISCPAMYSAPQHTSAFWSHVDLMATVCGLAGVKAPPTAGINQVPVLMTPTVPLRDSVLFAFDDAFLLEPDLPGCNPHIRALRTTQYTYAVYFSTTPATPFEYELYDNLADPLQMNNLLFAKPAALMDLWTTLDAQLQAAMREANAAPPNVVWQAPQPAG